jgi:hypothetical protein
MPVSGSFYYDGDLMAEFRAKHKEEFPMVAGPILRNKGVAMSGIPCADEVFNEPGQRMEYKSLPVEQHHPYGAPISKEELIEMRRKWFAKADSILLSKGNDYNASQQDAGDTLFNLRTCAMLGVVSSPVDGILVRLSDKLMRLISLTRPSTVQKVKDESIEDTVIDAINYLTYALAMIQKRKQS